MESLANIIADIVRTRLGIRREIMLVNIFRLTPTKWEYVILIIPITYITTPGPRSEAGRLL